MVTNNLPLQIQADLLNSTVVKPRVTETTALGAAYAAGLAVGYWTDLAEISRNWSEDRRWSPNMEPKQRQRLHHRWRNSVERTLDWVELDDPDPDIDPYI